MLTGCKRYINKQGNRWKKQGKLWDVTTIESQTTTRLQGRRSSHAKRKKYLYQMTFQKTGTKTLRSLQSSGATRRTRLQARDIRTMEDSPSVSCIATPILPNLNPTSPRTTTYDP